MDTKKTIHIYRHELHTLFRSWTLMIKRKVVFFAKTQTKLPENNSTPKIGSWWGLSVQQVWCGSLGCDPLYVWIWFNGFWFTICVDSMASDPLYVWIWFNGFWSTINVNLVHWLLIHYMCESDSMASDPLYACVNLVHWLLIHYMHVLICFLHTSVRNWPF